MTTPPVCHIAPCHNPATERLTLRVGRVDTLVDVCVACRLSFLDGRLPERIRALRRKAPPAPSPPPQTPPPKPRVRKPQRPADRYAELGTTPPPPPAPVVEAPPPPPPPRRKPRIKPDSVRALVLDDLAAHPWSRSGEVLARLELSQRLVASALSAATRAGELVQIGRPRHYRWAPKGTPLPESDEVVRLLERLLQEARAGGIDSLAVAYTHRGTTHGEHHAEALGAPLLLGALERVRHRILCDLEAGR